MPKTTIFLKNNPIPYNIFQISASHRKYFPTEVEVSVRGEKIGSMKYTLLEDCVWINRMDNHSIKSHDRYQHVGTALLDYAFEKSITEGKGGRIRLNSILASAPVYFKWGMRKEFPINGLISEYLGFKKSDPNKAAELKEKILQEKNYSSLIATAAHNLKKPAIKISFEEAIFEEAIIDNPLQKRQEEFAVLLKTKKTLDTTDCKNICGSMYIPYRTIQIKIKELVATKNQCKFFNLTPNSKQDDHDTVFPTAKL